MRTLLATSALLLALPAAAATFHAQPVTPAAAKVLVRDVPWRCGPAGCVAATDLTSARIACAGLARKVGRLASFSANGIAFDEAALARCNARAR